MILAIDVGGTYIKWGIFEDFVKLEYGKCLTPQNCILEFVETISNIVQNSSYELDGVAFSLPGTVNSETGYIKQGGSLRYLDDTNIFDVMSSLNSKISVVNDAKSATLCEMKYGNLVAATSGILIVVGTGIGSRYVLNKMIVEGSHMYAGELSMIKSYNTLTEEFGFWGDNVGMRGFLKCAAEKLGTESITGEHFIQLVKRNDAKALNIFKNYVSMFVEQLFNLQFIIDPELIVIGGGISEDSSFMDAIISEFESMFDVFPWPIKKAKIAKTQFGNDSNLIGAIINFIEFKGEK